MLTALDYAVSKIRQAIPKEILEKTFVDYVPRYKSIRSAVNIDTLIKNKVIRDIVLVDCNLIGANKIDIAIKPSWCEVLDSNQCIIRIPKTHTQNRSIIEVLDATYLPQSGYLMPYGTIQAVSDTTILTNKLMGSLKAPTIAGTVNTEIVGENTISMVGAGTSPSNMFLTVMVDYDDMLSQLKKQAYMKFGELCILACKSYIWANKIIDMDKSEIDGGYDLNRYTSIVEGYESAYEDYTVYFKEQWRKTSFMADPARYAGFINAITKVGLA